MANLYLPFQENGIKVWYKLKELIPKSTLDSSNTRVYLGELNYPRGSGDGRERLSSDNYTIMSYALSPRKIKLPRDYKKRVYAFNDNEIAASLVFDEINDLITLANRVAKINPFSLAYLAELNKRKLTLFPTLLLFEKFV